MSDRPDYDDFLFEAMSPNGNVVALLQAADDSVHFYLHGQSDTGFGMRSVWVRNLGPAPAGFDPEQLRAGKQPMMPAATCAHPQGAALPDPLQLRVIWFEEGDAAALLESDEIIAAIPTWSGQGGFHGYARDCTGESPLAWPLKEATVIYDRVARADEFWRSWEMGSSQWETIQEVFLRAYERVFGKQTRYWAIDGGGEWPPKAVAMFETDDAVIFLTLGVSIRPMPKVEMAFEDPSPHRRMELGVAIDRRLVNDATAHDVVAYMSAQSNLPWHLFTWLGPAHTVQCEPCPVGGGGGDEKFAAMLLLNEPPGAPKISVPAYRGDPVNLLWMTPITAAEWNVAQEQGSGEVIKRLVAKGPVWPHRERASVV